ncbi:transporter substrate-binding domain-containing protein [Bacillus xiapuensis]|uniref:Transporter substrate-binding domain-containing protein n=2 Tax=Bacillus xiapuensis TaxID=2014075 RepID=A0ABU6N735_9BACI|nr:transporter substrate-binding domain-containing protein [Bacillus xiapuensis]
MKKKQSFIAFILLLSVALVLSACSSSNGKSASKDNGSKNNLLQEVKDRGVLKVGVMGTYQPYNFLNKDKQMDGFDVDIAKEIGKRLGVKVEFVAQEFSGMIAGLQAQKFDAVISQMTITDDRKKQMDFSDPYITNNVKVIVRQDNNTIKSVNDFKGKDIGVGLGTNDETYLRTVLLPKVGDFNIKTYDDVITSLKDLDAGRIDATINNMYAIKPVVEKNGFKIKAVGEPVKSDQAGIAVRKGNAAFVKEINKILNEMKKDGTYKKIFVKWFGEEPAA